MTRRTQGPGRRMRCCAALALLALAAAATAGAGLLEPRGKKVCFGVSDTGDPADFGALQRPRSTSTRR